MKVYLVTDYQNKELIGLYENKKDVMEHFNNDVIFKDIYKGYKIKKDGSIKRYKVQVQIEDNVLREKILNTFPRDFDFNISRYKSQE